MKLISLFESLTGAKVKDCINNDRALFIVEENEIGKAIGKKGANIRRLEELLKKKVKVIEYNPDVVQFIHNFLFPLKVSNIENNDGEIIITGSDTKTKGLVIGRDKQNLNNLISIVGRYFEIKDIKVQ